MDAIAASLDASPHTPLFSEAQVRRLSPVDERSWAGQTVGTDFAGRFDASKQKKPARRGRPPRSRGEVTRAASSADALQ